MPRSSKVFKKRKPTFLGNRRSKIVVVNQDINNESDCDLMETCNNPTPTSTESALPKADSSSKKNTSDNFEQYQQYLGKDGVYDVKLSTIQELLRKLAICLHCGAKLYLVSRDRLGLGSQWN
uniref:Uncharacterized protein n=1 Tax=Clastoptera arizonana TaxID=38151 RepID=A0A1B6DC55_9HEMI